MIEKVTNLIKCESFYIPNILMKNYRSLGITDTEFVSLIYFINSDKSFNPKQISKDLNFGLNEVMEVINSLTEKNLLKVDVINNKVREEFINLDSLYEKLAFIVVNEEKETVKNNLFDKFESEFGRTLSPIDYEIINDWQNEFNDELILLALKEAVFNGVKNLRYIDKILRDWKSKNIKSEKDVKNEKMKFKENNSNKKLFEYDWLNERDS